MKKVLSIILALCLLICTVSVAGVNAYAATEDNYELMQQYNTQNTNTNFYGKKFVYAYFDGEKTQIRLSKSPSKKGKTIISVSHATAVSTDGKYVYWMNYAEPGIYRCDTKGKNLKKLLGYKATNHAVSYIIYKDKLIYLIRTVDKNGNTKSVNLYTATKDGKKKKVIVKDVNDRGFYAKDDKLYFIKNESLTGYDFTTKTETVIKALPKNSFIKGFEGKKAYLASFAYGDSDKCTTTFYSCSLKNGATKTLTKITSDIGIYAVAIVSKKVYVLTDAEVGYTFAQVKKGKFKSKSFKSKYAYSADSIGVYKDGIILDNQKINKDYAMRHKGFVKIVKF